MKLLLTTFLLVLFVISGNALLYENSTGMEELNAKNIDSSLIDSNSKTIWLVQFFSHWCGTCQNFVARWKKVVETVRHWSPIVRVAIVDCADVNLEACRRYKISGFPTIRLYWPGVVPADKYHDFGYLSPFSYSEVLDRISHAVYGMVSGHAQKKILPPHAKYILPTHFEDENFWKFERVGQTLLLVESDVVASGVIGPIVCLNTFSLHQATLLHVKYVVLNAEETKNARQLLADHLLLSPVPKNLDYPLLIELLPSREKAVKIIRTGAECVPYFLSLIEERSKIVASWTTANPGVMAQFNFPTTTAAVTTTAKTTSKPTTTTTKNNAIRVKGASASWSWLPEDDLYGAIYHIMNNEVALADAIPANKVADLKAFLDLVVKHVRFPNDDIVDTIKYLHGPVSKKKPGEKMTMEEWSGILYAADMPPPKPWKHCKGSKPQFRGYPCSLWLLFHTMTAHASSDPESSDDNTVIPGIRGYISSFFGCRGCAEHFLNATAQHVSTPNSDADVFLWKIHNWVNARLSGAASEDPLAPKIQYPNKHTCPECYADGHAKDSSQWDEDAISDFIRDHYSSNSIVPMELIEYKRKKF